MKFRPCIDIHNGKVKQIVGGSLLDEGNLAKENFVSEQSAAFFAKLYRDKGLQGGHIILLNPVSSEFYEKTRAQALSALKEYPGGLMVGGGLTPDNAGEYLDAGASHVIVTSYVFQNGRLHYDKLREMVKSVSKKRLVLDLSCRKKDDKYYIVTDRWQKFTDVTVSYDVMNMLASYCDEFLIHAVDVEGKANGIEENLVKIIAGSQSCPVTYAGGVGSYENLRTLKELGHNKIDVTIGSALDLFGGSLDFNKILEICRG